MKSFVDAIFDEFTIEHFLYHMMTSWLDPDFQFQVLMCFKCILDNYPERLTTISQIGLFDIIPDLMHTSPSFLLVGLQILNQAGDINSDMISLGHAIFSNENACTLYDTIPSGLQSDIFKNIFFTLYKHIQQSISLNDLTPNEIMFAVQYFICMLELEDEIFSTLIRFAYKGLLSITRHSNFNWVCFEEYPVQEQVELGLVSAEFSECITCFKIASFFYQNGHYLNFNQKNVEIILDMIDQGPIDEKLLLSFSNMLSQIFYHGPDDQIHLFLNSGAINSIALKTIDGPFFVIKTFVDLLSAVLSSHDSAIAGKLCRRYVVSALISSFTADDFEFNNQLFDIMGEIFRVGKMCNLDYYAEIQAAYVGRGTCTNFKCPEWIEDEVIQGKIEQFESEFIDPYFDDMISDS